MPQIRYTPNNPEGTMVATDLDRLAESRRQADAQTQMALRRLNQQGDQFKASMADRGVGRDFEREMLERKLGYRTEADLRDFGQSKELAGLQNTFATDRMRMGQDFQAEQAGLNRDFRAGESDEDRAFRQMMADRGFDFQRTMADEGRDFTLLRDDRQYERGAPDREQTRDLRQQQIDAMQRDAQSDVNRDVALTRLREKLERGESLSAAEQMLASEHAPRFAQRMDRLDAQQQQAQQEELQRIEEQAAASRDSGDILNYLKLAGEARKRTGVENLSQDQVRAMAPELVQRAVAQIEEAKRSGDPETVAALSKVLRQEVGGALEAYDPNLARQVEQAIAEAATPSMDMSWMTGVISPVAGVVDALR